MAFFLEKTPIGGGAEEVGYVTGRDVKSNLVNAPSSQESI